MSNYNSTLQSNNTDLQTVLQTLQNKAAGGEQATPVISVNNSNGLITATAGTKTSTHQLAFQAAKTITPSTTSQTAVAANTYTGGVITVAAIPSTYVQPTGTKTVTTNGTHDIKSYASVNVSVASSGGNTDVEDSLITRDMTTYTNDRVTTIGGYAFTNCSRLTSVSFPAVTTIGSYAFNNCSSLTSVSFPAVTTIGSYAFHSCSGLTSVSFPKVTSIGSYAFHYCWNLTSVSFPKVTSIGNDAFTNCSRLTSVSFPAVTTIGGYAFHSCSSLTSVSFPAVTTIGSYAFYYCRSLTSVSFPKVTSIGSYAFHYCWNLTSVSFPAVITISGSAFRNCYNLKSLYLTGSSVCTLSASNAFSSTPIGGYSASAGTYGNIYVPASLLASYKTATNWTYFSSRFVGI